MYRLYILCRMPAQTIINELLCFVSNRIDLLEVTILKKLCTETYSSEDILTAKDLLFAHCTNENVSLDINIQKRIGNDEDMRNLEDIVFMFLKMGKEHCPTFVAADLNKLPPIYLEHTDISPLLKTVTTLQRELKDLKASSLSHIEEIHKLKAARHET